MGRKKSFRKLFFSIIVFVLAFVFVPELDAEAATNEELQLVSKIFDVNYYAMMYPDVADRANGNPVYLLNHYVVCGVYEGRNPCANFNATDYKTKNPDLAAVYGDDMLAYVCHYVRAGAAEGRDGTPVAGVVEVVPPTNLTLLGVYVTDYDAKAARGSNIANASKKIGCRVLEPGQTFSASNSIGPRTTANGFVTAPVFIAKQHAMGLGGGVCQVSSTIYAATKMAGLKVSERHPHSLPVYYLPEGWDATISWGALDLKFSNPYDTKMLVCILADNGKLTAALYKEN
ncbi:VanW family protein [Pseudobutyrivibrio ruminis]|uniref:VanW family protein n=1 Tax=Pseudobutyrivibrio ruminis TaxID=46206 RepID=UPI0004250795|nr:VanW family protein [Pseudobutyrivibrio ruminis]